MSTKYTNYTSGTVLDMVLGSINAKGSPDVLGSSDVLDNVLDSMCGNSFLSYITLTTFLLDSLYIIILILLILKLL